MRKLFALAAALIVMTDLAGASDAWAKSRHRRTPASQGAATSHKAPAASQASHPGGGSNSK
jgi:hypothetical protein